MMRYSVILFDLDGTILNTLDDLAASTNRALAKNGLPTRSTEEVRRFVGNGIRLLIERAVPNGRENPKFQAVYDAFVAHYGAHSRDRTKPYDGILPMLDALAAQGVKLAIVSNKIDFAVKALSRDYFGGRMQAAIGDDPGRRRKPAPDSVLEAMRQPLEDGKVTVSRVNSTAVFPCNVMLIAAMNPCYCGYYGSNVKQCTCQASQIHRYLSKISGPILDRIDMQIEVSALKYSDLNATQKGESSESIRKRVAAARAIQKERYQDHGIHCNAQLKPKMMKEFCALGETEKAMMKNIFERLALSARAHDKILKVARTIADMEQSQTIGVQHIAQAVMYRSLDKRYRDVEKY